MSLRISEWFLTGSLNFETFEIKVKTLFITGHLYIINKDWSLNLQNENITPLIYYGYRRGLSQTVGTKHEKEDMNNISELGVKEWGRWYKLELKNLNGAMTTCATFIFKDPHLLSTCLAAMTHMLSLQTRPQSMRIIFWVYITLHTLLDKGSRYWQFTWQPYIYPYDAS